MLYWIATGMGLEVNRNSKHQWDVKKLTSINVQEEIENVDIVPAITED